MPIHFLCESCYQRVETPSATANQKGRCPHCGHVQTIPDKTPPPPAAPPALTAPKSTVDALLEDIHDMSAYTGSPEKLKEDRQREYKQRDKTDWGEDRYASRLVDEQNRLEATSRRLAIPAIGMIVCSGTLYVASIITVLVFSVYAANAGNGENLSVVALGVMLLIVAWNCLLATLGIVGANHMRQVRSYSQAIGGALLLCLPHIAWPLGVFFGIWALALLARADIRDNFRRA